MTATMLQCKRRCSRAFVLLIGSICVLYDVPSLMSLLETYFCLLLAVRVHVNKFRSIKSRRNPFDTFLDWPPDFL